MLKGLLLSATLLSSYPTVYHKYANQKPDSNSTYLGNVDQLIPDTSVSHKVADSYYLSVYHESSATIIPLKLVCDGQIITNETDLTFSITTQEQKTYSSMRKVNAEISKKTSCEISGIPFVNLEAEFSIKFGTEFSYGISYSTTNIASVTHTLHVDGKTNPYGIYCLAYCSTTTDKYYYYFSHSRFSNYDQPGEYQTLYLYENIDGHIYLPREKTTFVNKIYYFSTIEKYNDFVEEYSL